MDEIDFLDAILSYKMIDTAHRAKIIKGKEMKGKKNYLRRRIFLRKEEMTWKTHGRQNVPTRTITIVDNIFLVIGLRSFANIAKTMRKVLDP